MGVLASAPWPYEPLRAYIPFMPTATAPNHLSARQEVAAWLGVMGPPRPASTTEDQSVASLPQGGFFIFVAAKELASFLAAPETFGKMERTRWRERACVQADV